MVENENPKEWKNERMYSRDLKLAAFDFIQSVPVFGFSVQIETNQNALFHL